MFLRGKYIKRRWCMRNRLSASILGLLVSSSLLHASNVSAEASDSEQKLFGVYGSLQQLDMQSALDQSKKLAKSFPHYQVAQTLRADLLAIRSGQAHLVSSQEKKIQRKREEFIKEQQLRWTFKEETAESSQLAKVIKSSSSGHFIIVDAKLHRLFLYQQSSSGLQKIDDFYISVGRKGMGKQVEGDLKTPIGIYRIDGWKPGTDLPDLYGEGALTLNYPNAWDKKQGKTGNGIWLHGTPQNTYTREPLASRGCVVLTNPAVKKLKEVHGVGKDTLVMIVEGKSEELSFDENQAIIGRITGFLNENAEKVILSSLSVMRYPNETDLYYIRYQTQDGKSIEQFWKRSTDQWQTLVRTEEDLLSDQVAQLNLR